MNDLLQAVVSGIPASALVIGTDDRILCMNAGAEALIGAAALGRHHALSLRQPEMQKAIERVFASREPTQAKHILSGQSADTVHHVTMTPLKDVGILCVFEDRTSQEQVEQMRSQFVANVSHELRTPLTALLGFIETLRTSARNDAAARDRFLATMEREAGRMNRLIQDLLHLSRVEAEERVRPNQIIDLGDVLTTVSSTLRSLATTAKVSLEIQSLAPSTRLQGDHDQMVQVFQNLIENAIKYGGSGGKVVVRLEPDQLPRSAALRVDVIDYGEGMDPIHIPRLTERFYRVDGHLSLIHI